MVQEINDENNPDNRFNRIFKPMQIIYGLYRIDLVNLIKNKIIISKEYHIQPSEIDRLQFYEYEIYLEQLNLIAEQQAEENKKQQEQFDDMKSSMNPSKMMNNMSSNYKMPSVNTPSISSGNISMPKISIPKI